MKKCLLIFLFILSSFSGFSQNWINPGATWTFPWWYMAGMQGVDKIEYTHDTVILGKTCQVLHTTRKVYGPSGPSGPIMFWNTEHYYNYTYNNGDTVYYLADTLQYGGRNDFQVLYNFAATAGQSWYLGVDTNYFECGPALVNVDSVTSATIGGSSRRVIYTHDSTHSSLGLSKWFGHETKIVEGIGNMYYLFPQWRSCNSALDLYWFSFGCFTDGVNEYTVLEPGECDNPLHLGINDATEAAGITIYPNPAEDELSLSLSNSGRYTATIYNMLGQTVFGQTVTDAQTTLNIAALKPGIYMLSLSDQQGKATTQRFVKK